jgi:chitin disaccharide deacetylase
MTLGLIINADDYGRTPDISRGIRAVHLNGLVTSTTSMMNMPTTAADIKIVLQETPNLGLGVHLVLTAGKPLLPPEKVRSLVAPDGKFLSQGLLIQNATALNIAEAKAEWRTQIEAFIAAAGKNPTHLDSHHHSSYFTPGLLKAMFELAQEYQAAIRLPVASKTARVLDGIPGPLAAGLLEAAPKLIDEFQPRRPDGFSASFYDRGATREDLIRILDSLPQTGAFEIMCHPGYVDEAFARESVYAWQRQREFEILTDPAMRAEIEKRGIQLISFAQL